LREQDLALVLTAIFRAHLFSYFLPFSYLDLAVTQHFIAMLAATTALPMPSSISGTVSLMELPVLRLTSRAAANLRLT